jgi:hypothetical protein
MDIHIRSGERMGPFLQMTYYTWMLISGTSQSTLTSLIISDLIYKLRMNFELLAKC